MGALTDVIDLIEKLDKSIKDRKILDLLFPIKDKIHQAERENLAIEKEHFQLEKQHAKEMSDLNLSHSKEVSDLKEQISALESEINKNKKKAKGPGFMTFTP